MHNFVEKHPDGGFWTRGPSVIKTATIEDLARQIVHSHRRGEFVGGVYAGIAGDPLKDPTYLTKDEHRLFWRTYNDACKKY